MRAEKALKMQDKSNFSFLQIIVEVRGDTGILKPPTKRKFAFGK